MCGHELETIKDCLLTQVRNQMSNLSEVDTCELGEVIDMIKDLSEAVYYCTITEAMEKSDSNSDMNTAYYQDTGTAYYRDMDKGDGKMYYTGTNFSTGATNRGGSSSSSSHNAYDGKSSMSRRSYMEAKEMNVDKATQVRELERYISELSSDITEMIEGASQDEKQLLQRKISTLAAKIV